MNKKPARLRRAKRGRAKIMELEVVRLCVHRTSSHIYAQVISSNGQHVIASASTLEKQVKGKLQSTSNKEAAKLVGELVAKRALDKGVQKVAFDRSGYHYHGRVESLANAAREAGLQF